MSEMDPLNHIWLDFPIQSGLALHQFQKKLLLSQLKLKLELNSSLWQIIAAINIKLGSKVYSI